MKYSLVGSIPTWLAKIVEGINYKPGWSLYIMAERYYTNPMSHEPDVYGFAAVCTVEDRDTGVPVVLHGPAITLYRENMEERFVVEMIFRCIRGLEMHEMEEQFTYNGIRIFDPHREPADQKKLYELAERNPQFEANAMNLVSPELVGFRRLI